jgi:transposase-like protein
LFDGTYFHKKGCLIVMMDTQAQKFIASKYVDKESYHSVLPLFKYLKQKGVYPKAITIDGHRYVIQALKEVWPHAIIQRCLYHIQREGLRWLRTFPKTEAGRQLRIILSKLTSISNVKERDVFIDTYKHWENKHKNFVQSLPNTSVAFKDLKRTMSLINNALPNMFHYLKDQNIASTTNLLESFYSRLKADFYRHRGLSEPHKINYLYWYCYLKN